jgi:hypothetical protein
VKVGVANWSFVVSCDEKPVPSVVEPDVGAVCVIVVGLTSNGYDHVPESPTPAASESVPDTVYSPGGSVSGALTAPDDETDTSGLVTVVA